MSDTFGQENLIEASDSNIKNPFELRDPFKKVKLKRKSRKSEGIIGRDFSNVPVIDGNTQLSLSDMRVTGVFLGVDRRAIIAIGEAGEKKQQRFIIKEGMRIGENRAEVKAILPGGIVLVEKIKNIYDQDEYLETILPLTQ